MQHIKERPFIHAEVCLKPSNMRIEEHERVIGAPLKNYICKKKFVLNKQIKLNQDEIIGTEFESVQYLLLECPAKPQIKVVTDHDFDHIVLHIYQNRSSHVEKFGMDADSGDGNDVPSSNHWLLPSSNFTYLWENLIYEEGLKEKLLQYAISALALSQHKVNPEIVACNRLILLHGPPGTGKTSLCKALAQKLAIRKNSTFRHTHLIEINSHSLFSRWFSESGKLVMRLFSNLREIINDPYNLVVVLIDEVESLAYARNNLSGQEPKDAMRVVNALLTQLDSIKVFSNVFVLATSNLAETIDLAFLDRADVKQYIGLPTELAIESIYESMIVELVRTGVVINDGKIHKDLLYNLSHHSRGLSGRTVRKIPFLAHAHCVSNHKFASNDSIILKDFIQAMIEVVAEYFADTLQIKQK